MDPRPAVRARLVDEFGTAEAAVRALCVAPKEAPAYPETVVRAFFSPDSPGYRALPPALPGSRNATTRLCQRYGIPV